MKKIPNASPSKLNTIPEDSNQASSTTSSEEDAKKLPDLTRDLININAQIAALTKQRGEMVGANAAKIEGDSNKSCKR